MFYPILKLDNFQGITTIHNFPPNNWEKVKHSDKFIYLIWTDGIFWNTFYYCILKKNESIEINSNTLPSYLFISNLAFIYPSNLILENKINELPSVNNFKTKTPNWRATVGLESKFTKDSYQGEIEPFPSKSSLLTFHPFLQFDNFNNFLLLINLIKSPELTESDLEIFDSYTGYLIAKESVKTNSATLISLNKYNFKNNDLPIFINRKMAAIPFGFGYNDDQTILSLEHTHPPASLVLHGNRSHMQSIIKTKWFQKLTPNE
jgi:hypothetical protein